jgi:hypothetical protein
MVLYILIYDRVYIYICMIVYINIDNLHDHLIFVIGDIARGTIALADLETLQRLKSLCAACESLRTWNTQTYKKLWKITIFNR